MREAGERDDAQPELPKNNRFCSPGVLHQNFRVTGLCLQFENCDFADCGLDVANEQQCLKRRNLSFSWLVLIKFGTFVFIAKTNAPKKSSNLQWIDYRMPGGNATSDHKNLVCLNVWALQRRTEDCVVMYGVHFVSLKVRLHSKLRICSSNSRIFYERGRCINLSAEHTWSWLSRSA